MNKTNKALSEKLYQTAFIHIEPTIHALYAKPLNEKDYTFLISIHLALASLKNIQYKTNEAAIAHYQSMLQQAYETHRESPLLINTLDGNEIFWIIIPNTSFPLSMREPLNKHKHIKMVVRQKNTYYAFPIPYDAHTLLNQVYKSASRSSKANILFEAERKTFEILHIYFINFLENIGLNHDLQDTLKDWYLHNSTSFNFKHYDEHIMARRAQNLKKNLELAFNTAVYQLFKHGFFDKKFGHRSLLQLANHYDQSSSNQKSQWEKGTLLSKIDQLNFHSKDSLKQSLQLHSFIQKNSDKF